MWRGLVTPPRPSQRSARMDLSAETLQLEVPVEEGSHLQPHHSEALLGKVEKLDP